MKVYRQSCNSRKGFSRNVGAGEGGGGSSKSLQCTSCLKKVFVCGVLIQREVHHFRGGHPVGLRGNSSPELWLICAVQLHWVPLPGGQTLYHTSAGMGTSGFRGKKKSCVKSKIMLGRQIQVSPLAACLYRAFSCTPTISTSLSEEAMLIWPLCWVLSLCDSSASAWPETNREEHSHTLWRGPER